MICHEHRASHRSSHAGQVYSVVRAHHILSIPQQSLLDCINKNTQAALNTGQGDVPSNHKTSAAWRGNTILASTLPRSCGFSTRLRTWCSQATTLFLCAVISSQQTCEVIQWAGVLHHAGMYYTNYQLTYKTSIRQMKLLWCYFMLNSGICLPPILQLFCVLQLLLLLSLSSPSAQGISPPSSNRRG